MQRECRPNRIIAAQVDGTGAGFQVRGITELFETTVRTVPYVGFGAGRTYDVTGDGKRFLVNLAAAEDGERCSIRSR